METSGLDRLLAYARPLAGETTRRKGDDARPDAGPGSPRRGGEAEGVRVTLSGGETKGVRVTRSSGEAEGVRVTLSSDAPSGPEPAGPDLRSEARSTVEQGAAVETATRQPEPATTVRIEGRAGRAVAAYRRTEAAATGHLFRQKA